MDRRNNLLYLSKIFYWFEEDFVEAAGSLENLVAPYLKEEVRLFLKDQRPKIRFLEYDWSLNAEGPLR
ncbi:MAG: hypothetical protein HY787_22355 [Deltaproteobacteria bacterium]|nr:hypothetical protein [Deltaproteobacteria bacterium]